MDTAKEQYGEQPAKLRGGRNGTQPVGTSADWLKYTLHSTRYLRQEHAREASRSAHYAVASRTHT